MFGVPAPQPRVVLRCAACIQTSHAVPASLASAPLASVKRESSRRVQV